MLRLTAELREWNKRINLTAITGPADMVDKHLLDSLSVQPLLHGRRAWKPPPRSYAARA